MLRLLALILISLHAPLICSRTTWTCLLEKMLSDLKDIIATEMFPICPQRSTSQMTPIRRVTPFYQENSSVNSSTSSAPAPWVWPFAMSN